MPCRAATHFPGTARRGQIPGQQGSREAAGASGSWGGLQRSWATGSPKGLFSWNGAGGCCVFMESSRPDGLCLMSPWPPARSLCSLRVRAGPGRAPIPCWGSGGEWNQPRGARRGKRSLHPGWGWRAHKDLGGSVIGGAPIWHSERRGARGHWPGRADLMGKRCACGQLGHGGNRGQEWVGDGRRAGAATPGAASDPGRCD